MNDNQLNGSDGVSEDLLPLVYEELRRLARHRMQQEAGPQTLSATALVHEAYLRISTQKEDIQWENKRHFFAAAAEAMRRILVDRARAKKRLKRGGELKRVDWVESQMMAPMPEDEILVIHEILDELSIYDIKSAELIKMKYFAGMTWEEICDATGEADRSLRRRWTYARAWLRERMNRELS